MGARIGFLDSPSSKGMNEKMNKPNQNGKYEPVSSYVIRTEKYYSYEVMEEDIKLLASIYPFVTVNVIGKSVLGKSLYELRIGKGERRVHINGSFHANEWLTSSISMQFVNDYASAVKNGQKIGGIDSMLFFEQLTLSIVPMVNPDGVELVLNGAPASHKQSIEEMNKENYEYSWWKANINGVDLNNQFPAKWEVEKERKYAKEPSPRDYPGKEPLSEPESKALAELAKKEKFDMILALHSQGKEIYWGYEGYEPAIAKEIVQEMEKVSGYKGIQYIDSHAGFRDWFIQEFQKPGYTIEVGEGVNPLPLSSFQENYQDTKNIIVSCLKGFIDKVVII